MGIDPGENRLLCGALPSQRCHRNMVLIVPGEECGGGEGPELQQGFGRLWNMRS